MPWCEPCERFWNPGSVTADGACPTCGAVVAGPLSRSAPRRVRAPWHFWVVLAAAAAYLAWRAVQGIALLL
ncbi:hypothetical protein [Candidatus Poriferisocius sp.]|uniref:hypothetical protein n=1 Tax=Candidatus Poriferisocius sp. TaxID=3101276 RepID=UPI003B5A0804